MKEKQKQRQKKNKNMFLRCFFSLSGLSGIQEKEYYLLSKWFNREQVQRVAALTPHRLLKLSGRLCDDFTRQIYLCSVVGVESQERRNDLWKTYVCRLLVQSSADEVPMDTFTWLSAAGWRQGRQTPPKVWILVVGADPVPFPLLCSLRCMFFKQLEKFGQNPLQEQCPSVIFVLRVTVTQIPISCRKWKISFFHLERLMR